MSLERQDPELFRMLQDEVTRQTRSLTLIASENHCSPAVREAMTSLLTDKYAEGYPGRRYYGGCEVGDEVERLARDRAKQLFSAEAVNVQPHSGTQANLAAYLALMEPGERMVAMALNAGGHLSHGFARNHTGMIFEAHHYGLHDRTGWIDYEAMERLAKEHRPKLLIGGGSAYPRLIDWERMRRIADEVGAKLLADIAHPAGLVASGVIPTPVGIADVVTMTTHKTLRGPRGGLILSREEHRKAINSSVFPGGQGGPFLHAIAAKAVAFGEALQPEFRQYQVQVVRNAQALGQALVERGFELVTGGTDTHLVLVDLRAKDMSGRQAEDLCLQANLVVNKNLVPNDPRKAMETSGLRLGTPAVTTRGMREEHMVVIAGVIDRLLTRGESEIPAAGAATAELAAAHPLP